MRSRCWRVDTINSTKRTTDSCYAPMDRSRTGCKCLIPRFSGTHRVLAGILATQLVEPELDHPSRKVYERFRKRPCLQPTIVNQHLSKYGKRYTSCVRYRMRLR